MKGKTIPETKKSVGIWLRVSTEMQAESDSPEHHRARAMSYAAAKDWNVREVYDLSGVSGKSVMEHPETKRMMADVKRGHITGLIFSKLARLARNTKELLDFSEFFQEHDADLISLQEAIDTGTPAGRLFYTIIAAMAEWERSEIAERVKASVVVRAKMGKPLGQLPYGFRYREGKVEPDPNEAPTRKLVYELFAEHKRKKSVARMLNEKGLRTRGGHRFSDTTIDRLITDPAAKGDFRTNYTRKVGNGKAWTHKPEHEWVVTKVPAIVSEELWTRCNALLEARKTQGARPTKRAIHTFTGVVFCACGQKMYVPSDSPKYVCQSCRNKIPMVDLDALFRDELKAYLTTPEKVEAYRAHAEHAIDEERSALSTLKKELSHAKQEIEKTFSLYNADALSIEQFKQRYQPLDERKKQIEGEIPRLEGVLAHRNVEKVSSEEIMAEAHDFYNRWPTFDAAQKRRLVETLVKRVTIGKDEVTIELCYLPSFEMVADGQRMDKGSSRPQA